ncbi:MAG TPA: cytochrome c [Xanthomonadaceae bacterium]|jgi:cytochrome c553|nr:cytochrome c [Xanthomonadaceae bacterium]
MTLRILSASLLLVLAGSALARGDAAAGAAKAKSCTACHGTDGNATQDSQYPRLAGQYADYIARALHEYKNGDRTNPIMKGMATPLSDQDIDDVAAYFSSLPGKLHDLSHMKK